MSDALYVATDAHGVEHAATGHIEWELPVGGVARDITPGATMILRRAKALLEVLDERIFVAATNEPTKVDERNEVEVDSAHLVKETSWNATAATQFAISCATHLLGVIGDFALPNGASLSEILADAQKVFEGVAPDAVARLDYLARVRALRRLKHDRRDLAIESFRTLLGDEQTDVDALDDPDYETLAPVTDAVLAAIEALRHHLYPHLYLRAEDTVEERLEHDVEDRQTVLPTPSVVGSPFGPIPTGGGPTIEYDPAWTSAREASRHARLAVEDRLGRSAGLDELTWQADTLEAVLNEPESSARQ